ncbi:MAG: hypothetical protein EZS28_026098 [Streblomastix strix]|uniref:Uncharacterized protein n=1 Tax=Streblomastix strix TaxID=222440 RepID=A0A5J4V635_9EUKA|nr:MAG: hypothetical protein EZS28_026098 [Streblomastix strix]
MYPTPGNKQGYRPTPRLISRNSWTDQGGKEERRECLDLENSEIYNDNEEILDRNGGTDGEIFGIVTIDQQERLHPTRIHPSVERQFEYQQTTTLIKDIEIQVNGRRSERIQDIVRRITEREYQNIYQK